MSRDRVFFVCQNCGYRAPRWLGKCPDCGAWNSLVEERAVPEAGKGAPATASGAPKALDSLEITPEARVSCSIGELDRVLGGGFVPGSLTLIGGDPGIGKSTLLLQAMNALAQTAKTLYITAEESARQIRLRADRLGVSGKQLFLLAETSIEAIAATVRSWQPAFLVVDSIQTVFSADFPSAPGSVGQVRECCGQLMRLAKGEGVTTCIAGHVTKDGAIAGPRLLEHMVDTVLYFEGDASHPYRILRAVKNRFGSTNEIGVFEMTGGGLREVPNPSELFLQERPEGSPGSVVTPALEGTRPILVELQALVSGASFGTPQRSTIGIDHKRVALLIAVLEKKAGIPLMGQDVFVNVAGGVRLNEPAPDLGVVAALLSSHLNRPVAPQTLVFGEVGLAGEVRAVSHPDIRLNEAERLGFKRCLLPAGNARKLAARPRAMELVAVSGVGELLEKLF
jgi:DNA repair protein RadA/Sms